MEYYSIKHSNRYYGVELAHVPTRAVPSQTRPGPGTLQQVQVQGRLRQVLQGVHAAIPPS